MSAAHSFSVPATAPSSSSQAKPRVDLTLTRLQFLHGDLDLDLRHIVRMTGWSRAEVNALLTSAGIRKGYPAHLDVSEEDYKELARRLDLSINAESKRSLLWHELRARYRTALVEYALAHRLDWAVLDQFVAELPARQEAEDRRTRAVEQEYDERERRRRQAAEKAKAFLRDHLEDAQHEQAFADRGHLTQRDEANVLMAYVFEHTSLEDVCHGPTGISEEERKRLKIGLSAQLAALLHLRATDPERYAAFVDESSRRLHPTSGERWPAGYTTSYRLRKSSRSRCLSCQMPVRSSWRFCPTCGQQLAAESGSAR